jgi:hypothetical protein
MNETMLTKLLDRGPERVMVADLESRTPDIAARDFGVFPDVVLVRNGGDFTLGAPARLFEAAYRTWAKEWTHFVLKNEGRARPISELPKFRFLFDGKPKPPPQLELSEEHVEFLDSLQAGGGVDMLNDAPQKLVERELFLRWAEGYAERKGTP